MSTRATGVVGIAILSSRFLGLIREMVFASLFGAGRNLDAFLMAFRLPNLLRDLFAEGALSTAFITTFSKKIAVDGDQSAWRLANKVATLTAVFMSVITLLGIVCESNWGAERIVALNPGETVSLSGYNLTFDGLEGRDGPNFREMTARFTVRDGTRVIGMMEPAKRSFPARSTATTAHDTPNTW